MPIIGTATIWMIALMVPNMHMETRKLAIYEFNSKIECQESIPYLKRYYRLYGDSWTARCTRTRKLLPATRLNYGSM